MGQRIARIAYADECSAAVRTVLNARRQRELAPLPAPGVEAEVRMYSCVAEELHRRNLGMPPSVDRTRLAAIARQTFG